jgi:sigma-B regulation protein RsbU (phosphoserine phosphatase)
LVTPEGQHHEVLSAGPIIGMVPDMEFDAQHTPIPPGSLLHIFSDGIYEVELGGRRMEYDEFAAVVARVAGTGGNPHAIHAAMQEIQGRAEFEDDVSLLQLRF